jgi:hypothetical protein
MITLPKTYSKNGYRFEEVERIGDVAIYRQVDPDTGRTLAFEVFEVLKNKEKVIAGKALPAKEGTPSNEQWGLYGFTVWQFPEAEKKRDILLERINRRKIGQTPKAA